MQHTPITLRFGAGTRTMATGGRVFDLNKLSTKDWNRLRRLTVEAKRIEQEATR